MNNDADIYEKLVADYKPEQSLQERSNISTQEKGKRYKAAVKPKRQTVVFQVDGCIVKDGCKCDKLILSKDVTDESKWYAHFIELKGHDVTHALKQLKTTLNYRIFKDPSITKRFARVVGSSYPSSAGNPEFEKLRISFKKNLKCELKTLKSDQPDTI